MKLFSVKFSLLTKDTEISILPMKLSIIAQNEESAILKAERTLPKSMLESDQVIAMRAEEVLGETNNQLISVLEFN